MASLHSILFSAHIILGTMALIVFWIPLVSIKGSLNHKKFGRYYSWTMYAVACSGALMAILVIYDPLAIKGHLMTEETDPQNFTASLRIFWGFLLYLSLITYSSIRQGEAVLKHKNNPEALRRFSHIMPLVLLIIGGGITTVNGLLNHTTLHIIFGILGCGIGFSMLRFCLKQQHSQKQWIIEHLSAMIGSGIGAYTAFIAFGGRHIFSHLGDAQIIFWVAPGVIGGLAIFLLSKNYGNTASLQD
ncbi:hypothetical protein [Aliiglaciecola sp. NS0011-25]|uniref:hypothetical protein n=1 Tax=Aliiglaciecola sp. NS0011-25 TaxID=3127654 RepID=UPI0031095D8D